MRHINHRRGAGGGSNCCFHLQRSVLIDAAVNLDVSGYTSKAGKSVGPRPIVPIALNDAEAGLARAIRLALRGLAIFPVGGIHIRGCCCEVPDFITRIGRLPLPNLTPRVMPKIPVYQPASGTVACDPEL